MAAATKINLAVSVDPEFTAAIRDLTAALTALKVIDGGEALAAAVGQATVTPEASQALNSGGGAQQPVAPAAPAPAPAPAPAANGDGSADVNAVRAVMREYGARFGREAAVQLMGHFGASTVTALPAEAHAQVIETAKAHLAQQPAA